jgi:bromodomain-containing factor 1
MMASSTQESQSFVANEVHTDKGTINKMALEVPQKMEVDVPLTSAQPLKVPNAAPVAAPAPTNAQATSVPTNAVGSSSPAVSAPVAIPTQAPANVPTPAAPVANAPAPVSNGPVAAAQVMKDSSAEHKSEPNGVLATEKPTTGISGEVPAPQGDASAAAAPNPELEKLILQEQFKFCSTVVKQMKKRKEGFLFSNPVDPVRLNIPTYFDVIESPMDLSTVEKKISSHTYKTPNEFKDDITLMFNNCYKFNGMEAQVSKMGMDLQKYFEKEWEKLPKEVRFFSI